MQAIMIVDDSPTMRNLIKLSLIRLPRVFTVEAGDGHEALMKMRAGAPAMILSSLRMQGMGGLDLVAEVRRQKTAQSLPIVLLAAENERDEAERGIALGANDYLLRPLTAVALTEKVRRFIPSRETALSAASH